MPQVEFNFDGQKYRANVEQGFFNLSQEQQQQMLFDSMQTQPVQKSLQQPQEDENTTRWEAMKFAGKKGFFDTYRGAKQLLGLDVEEEEANQEQLNKYMNDPNFGGWATGAYFAGAILDPAGWLIPATKAKTLGKMAMYGMGTGALAGATGYVDENAKSLIGEGKMTRTEQALIGGAGGSVLTPFMGKMINLSKKAYEPAGEAVWNVISKNPEPGGAFAGGMVGYHSDKDATSEDKMKNALVGATLGIGGGTGLRIANKKGSLSRFFLTNAGLDEGYRKTKQISKRDLNKIQREFVGLLDNFQNETDDNRRILYEMLTGDAYDFKEFAQGKGISVEVRDFSGDFTGLEKTTPKLREKFEEGSSAFFEKPVIDAETGKITKPGTLYFDPIMTRQKYRDKAWRTPRTEGVEPLPDEAFETYWDWERFVKTHEIQHIKNPQIEGEARGAYENRINRLALDEMRDNPFELRLKKDVDAAREVINKYGEALTDLGVLSKETFMENYDTYLHRMYKNPEFELAKQNILRANKVNEIRTIGSELKSRGRIEEVLRSEWDLNKDYYLDPKHGFEILQLSNTAGSPIDKASKFIDPEFTMRLRDADNIEFDKVVLRRDYSKAERQQLGEVQDASIALARTSQLLSNDVSALRFYKTISDNYGVDPNNLERATQGAERVAPLRGEMPEGWQPGPESGLVEVPNKKRFGELAGKYLPKDIHHDIVTMDDWKSGSFLNTTSPTTRKIFDIWKAINGYWKLTKTAYNLPVHMNNFGSNIVMYDLNDGSMKGLNQAFKQLLFPSVRGASDRLKLAQDYDVFGGNFIGQDVLKRNAQLYRSYGETAGSTGIDSLDRLVLNMPKTMMKILRNSKKFTTDKMQELYTWEDNLFRLGLFNTFVDKGMSPELAAIKAREGFVDYAATSPVLEALRHTALPFVAYAYGIAPRLAEAAAKRPWKFAKWAAIVGGINAIGEDLTNDPEKVKRERMIRDNTLFDLPFLPYTNIKMSPQTSMTPPKGVDSSTYADVTRMVPGQMFTPESAGGFKIPGAPSSVQPSFGALGGVLFPWMGIPSMGDKPIPKEDRPSEILRQFVPNLPIPGLGTYAGNKLKRGFTEGGFVSDFKDTQTRLSSMLQTLGVRFNFVEAEKEGGREFLRLKKLYKDQQNKMMKLETDFQEGQISKSKLEEGQAEIEAKVMEIERIAESKGL